MKRYAPLLAGAVAAGLAIGAMSAWWPGDPAPMTVPEPAISRDAIAGAPPGDADLAWQERAAPGAEQAGGDMPTGEAQGVSETARETRFGFCHVGGGDNCVVDGDSIWMDGQNIRIADIDAPETHDHRCAGEKALGDRATRRLLQLVNSGTVSLAPVDRDSDSYGRKLRIVLVDGRNVGTTLVAEGLARRYEGGRKSWC